MTRRWSFHAYTPSQAELAHRRAMSYPRSAFGPSVRSYLPEEAQGLREGSEAERRALRWLYSCAECRRSETGLSTREQAHARLRAHRERCDGTEPGWLVRARGRYADERERMRGLPPPHKSRSSAVRKAYWNQHNARRS